MTTDTNNPPKNNGDKQPLENSEIQGRIHNSENPAFEQLDTHHDISRVDQQEGNMEHGEVGPDFTNEAGQKGR